MRGLVRNVSFTFWWAFSVCLGVDAKGQGVGTTMSPSRSAPPTCLSPVYATVHISRGRCVLCQDCALQGVAALVVSFVPTECPVGRGMWGIFEKPLKRAFRSCMVWGGGGLAAGTIFFEHGRLPLTIWVVFACSGQVSDTLHCTPTPITRCTFGLERYPPPHFGVGKFRKLCFREGWDRRAV